MFLTCRNDPDAKGAGKQSFFWTVWIYTTIYLSPPDEPMDDLAEHAIPSDTHHPEPRVKIMSQQVDEPYVCIIEEGKRISATNPNPALLLNSTILYNEILSFSQTV